MAGDNKDRLGNKIHDAEAAREDQWARQRDAELIEKMRERLSKMVCPDCKQFLVSKTESGLRTQSCPSGHGAWLGAPDLKAVLKDHK
jgi:hypothetical protein